MHLSSSEEKLSGRKSPRFVGKRERERERESEWGALSQRSLKWTMSQKKSQREKRSCHWRGRYLLSTPSTLFPSPPDLFNLSNPFLGIFFTPEEFIYSITGAILVSNVLPHLSHLFSFLRSWSFVVRQTGSLVYNSPGQEFDKNFRWENQYQVKGLTIQTIVCV